MVQAIKNHCLMKFLCHPKTEKGLDLFLGVEQVLLIVKTFFFFFLRVPQSAWILQTLRIAEGLSELISLMELSL